MNNVLVNKYRNNRALIIRMAPYYTTQAIPRIANFLINNGFEVSVLSKYSNDENDFLHESYEWKVFWKKITYKSGNRFSFLLGWFKWWWWVIKHISQNDYAIIHALNLESVIPAYLGKILFLKKCKLIYDVRDPWGMLFPKGFNPIKSFIVFVDRIIASKVDGIILSQGILKKTGDYFGEKTKSKIPIAQVLNVPQKDLVGKYLQLNSLKPIRINFSGHISYKRNAKAVIDLAKEFPTSVKIDVVGTIRDKNLFKELESIHNISIHGYLSFNKAMEYIRRSHLVLILYDTSTDVAIVSSANKMFESMMYSRPYIASKNGFPGIVAEKYNLGFTIEFGSSNALINLVKKIMLDPRQLEKMSKTARTTYEQEFMWDKQETNIYLFYDVMANNKKEYNYSSYGGWMKIIGEYYSV